MKLGSVISPSFNASYSKLLNASLPVKTMFNLKKFTDKLGKEQKAYEETRVQLCKEYAEKDEKGEAITKDNVFQFDQERVAEFNGKMSELLETEIEIKFKIPAEQLDKANLSTADLFNLGELIEEPKEE